MTQGEIHPLSCEGSNSDGLYLLPSGDVLGSPGGLPSLSSAPPIICYLHSQSTAVPCPAGLVG